MRPWKTIHKSTVLDFNKFLRVEQHSIELPDGKMINDWPWVVSPDYVLVLPVTPRRTLMLFRQTKYAVEGISLAPIGGYLEPGENALTTAKRELREELGCQAGSWVDLGSFPTNGNHGGGRAHLFLALDIFHVGEPIKDDLEDMEPVETTLDVAEQRLFQGEVKVLGWLGVIAMGLLYLKSLPSSRTP